MEVLLRRAVEVGAVVARLGSEFDVVERRLAVGGQQLTLRGLGGEYPEVFLPLFGEHQAENAATALAAASLPAVFEGLEEILRHCFVCRHHGSLG